MKKTMKVFYSDLHKHHNPSQEFTLGKLTAVHENPHRIETILEHLKKNSHLELINHLSEFSEDLILKIHSLDYVNFLKNAYAEWKLLGRRGDLFPSSWSFSQSRNTLKTKLHRSHLDSRIGYYATDSASPLTETSWLAIKASADCALTAAQAVLQGESSSFALCRPPGHHANQDSYGGFCFLNNSAIAAQYLRDSGQKKIAILDLDYHHGNGTQDIFYSRDDVFTLSLHVHPELDFPYYSGFSDECGEAQGFNYNYNIPLAFNTEWSTWEKALTTCLDKIKIYNPNTVIIGLGVDTYENDPISHFKLKTENYFNIGQHLSKLNIPLLFVLEGGYDIDDLGRNVNQVLNGYLNIK